MAEAMTTSPSTDPALAASASPLTSGTSTSYLVAQVHHAVRTRLEAAMKPHNITPLQFTILEILATRDRVTSADMSRRFFVTPQTMGETISNLERRGFVARQSDPSNKRILHVVPTAEGRALVTMFDSRLRVIEDDIYGELDGGELIALRGLLQRLMRSLRDQGEIAPGEPAPVSAPS
jgi:DNA-binding MarR family transcriptional regulator